MILSAEKKTKFIDLLTVILFCNNCNCSNCNRKLALLSHFHEFTELEVVCGGGMLLKLPGFRKLRKQPTSEVTFVSPQHEFSSCIVSFIEYIYYITQ